MIDYVNLKCDACRVGSPLAENVEIEKFISKNSEWVKIEIEKIPQLKRVYNFQNYQEALNFTNSIASLAEEEGHHPAILTEWDQVTLRWWTHKIKGLHLNDLIMASKSDKIYEEF